MDFNYEIFKNVEVWIVIFKFSTLTTFKNNGKDLIQIQI